MNKKFFVSAAASAAMALVMGANAMAADIGTTSQPYKASGITYVDRSGNTGIKDLVVEAGTDPKSVELHFAGAQKVEFGEAGGLRITRANGSIWHYKPQVYQLVNGKRHYVVVGFHFIGKDRVALRPGRFDTSAPLVVGPVDGPNGNS